MTYGKKGSGRKDESVSSRVGIAAEKGFCSPEKQTDRHNEDISRVQREKGKGEKKLHS